MTKKPLSKKERREIERKAKAEKRSASAAAREPNGRLSRRKADVEARGELAEKDVMSVAIDARMRHHGLTEDQASKNEAGGPTAGNAHGRMRLLAIASPRLDPAKTPGLLSADQWTAAEWYIQTRSSYMRSILAKGEAAQPEGPSHGMEDSESYIEWCKQIAARWQQVLDCLRDASTKRRSPVSSALDVILLRNQYLEHMERDLKAGLDALHATFLAGRKRGEEGGDGARLSEAQLNAMAGHGH